MNFEHEVIFCIVNAGFADAVMDAAKEFADHLNEKCIDSSAQIYKVNCPPAVLLKPPVISSCKVIDYIVEQIESV